MSGVKVTCCASLSVSNHKSVTAHTKEQKKPPKFELIAFQLNCRLEIGSQFALDRKHLNRRNRTQMSSDMLAQLANSFYNKRPLWLECSDMKCLNPKTSARGTAHVLVISIKGASSSTQKPFRSLKLFWKTSSFQPPNPTWSCAPGWSRRSASGGAVHSSVVETAPSPLQKSALSTWQVAAFQGFDDI